MTVSVRWLFLAIPWVGLQCVIVVFPDHSHLLFYSLHSRKIGMFLSAADFFNINFFENVFKEYHPSVKQFGFRSGPTFCRA